MNVLSVPQTN